MRIKKMLIVCSTLDLDYPFGTTPAWWQLFKGLFEQGVDLIVIPYRGKSIRSLWWRCYQNPSNIEGALYDILNSLFRKTPGSHDLLGSKKERFIPKIARTLVRPKWKSLLIKILKKERDVDAIVFLQVPLNHLKGIPSEIKREFGLPIIFFDGDMPVSLPSYGGFTFNYYIGADLSEYDMIVGNSDAVLEELKAMGAQRVQTIHYGVDPDVFAPIRMEQDIDVFFQGLGSRFREKWIYDLIINPSKSLLDIKFVVSGKGLGSDMGRAKNLGMVPFNSWRQLCCRSKINLNITRETHSKTPLTSSSRPFELSSLGCCVVSNPYNGLEKWFKMGEEMFIAQNEKEATELYRWLLPLDEERRKIGNKARQRVLKEHTSRHRAKQFLDLIESI